MKISRISPKARVTGWQMIRIIHWMIMPAPVRSGSNIFPATAKPMPQRRLKRTLNAQIARLTFEVEESIRKGLE